MDITVIHLCLIARLLRASMDGRSPRHFLCRPALGRTFLTLLFVGGPQVVSWSEPRGAAYIPGETKAAVDSPSSSVTRLRAASGSFGCFVGGGGGGGGTKIKGTPQSGCRITQKELVDRMMILCISVLRKYRWYPVCVDGGLRMETEENRGGERCDETCSSKLRQRAEPNENRVLSELKGKIMGRREMKEQQSRRE
ncbi:hypothetical protein EYF80_001170 [Liparis tanakae]|uniref:Uncharacterized protein n=1 Tax=Liparis tanakae TaxID=230148 RepID=A0A4Z2JFJ9_9TELE|nr:hypothetical protein EYF80_001170 [Liparis tanakae]